MRLLEAKTLVRDILFSTSIRSGPHRIQTIATLSDWGAGNGGLLHELRQTLDFIPDGSVPLDTKPRMWGYDLCPDNVRYGVEKYGLDLKLMNVVSSEPEAADVVVLTEFLEHLVNPHELLGKLGATLTRWLVASTPGFEDYQNFYPYHLWAWTGDSFAQMFERIGWKVKRHFTVAECGTQFLVAEK